MLFKSLGNRGPPPAKKRGKDSFLPPSASWKGPAPSPPPHPRAHHPPVWSWSLSESWLGREEQCMDAAATEGRHRTCKPRKKASVQSRRYSSRAPPAGPSLRSGGGTARQPPRPHLRPAPPPAAAATGRRRPPWTRLHGKEKAARKGNAPMREVWKVGSPSGRGRGSRPVPRVPEAEAGRMAGAERDTGGVRARRPRGSHTRLLQEDSPGRAAGWQGRAPGRLRPQNAH